MPPVSFNGIRNLLAGLCLSVVVLIADRTGFSRKPASPGQNRLQKTGGFVCGIFLFLASTLQQIGLVDTSAGKAGFITALYVVLVPVTGWILFRRNPGRWIWFSVMLAVTGLFLLCVPAGEKFSLNKGDLMVLGCAVCFTGQILAVDHFVPLVDPVRLSRDEFLVCGIIGLLVSLLTETVTPGGLRDALPAILYAGIISGAVGYTLQILGQRDTNPTLASLLMCLESVFAVLGGAMILGERMSMREGTGCAVLFIAVILAQISPLLKGRKPSS